MELRPAHAHLLRPTRLAAMIPAALAVAGCSSISTNQTATQQAQLSALEKPAEVLIDQWGIPHIYASTTYDAFVVQGYMAARDRLWQMDLWRKRGLGEMAADFGASWVENDKAARAVLFRGDMYREWLAYGSDSKRVAEAFVAGVNAYVAQTRADPGLLPEEFKLLDYKPAQWAAEDVVRIRHHGLTLNFTSEVDRAQAFCDGKSNGARVDWLRRELVPDVKPQVPEGLAVCGLPGKELKQAYALATASPKFTKDNVKVLAAHLTPDELLDLSGTTLNVADANTMASYGSNNWTIAPSMTTTGRPILANDPHRAHGAPSLRYISHISAPGMDVIGAGEPFLPGISIGHNGRIAFGLTRFYMDQEDLYVYETFRTNEREYKYQGRWEPMTKETELIVVKGEGAPRKVDNWYTRHGPVLYSAKGRAYALRAAWLDLGMAPYFGSMDYMRAQNFDQFRAAMNRWGAPGENQVYADNSGNIGWIPGGLTPIRPNWDGLMPVPGDGRYEWSGYRNGDELPWEFNPKRGYVVTANENNVPPEHPLYQKGIGYEWSDSARAQRLHALFQQAAKDGKKLSVADSEAWQTDIVAVPAQRLLKLLAPLESDNGQIAEGLALLKNWNGTMSPNSPAAALYEVWSNATLKKAVSEKLLAQNERAFAKDTSATRMISVLESPQGWMSPADRDQLLLSSIAPAMQWMQGKQGADATKWSWGGLHQANFVHPLAGVVDDASKQRFNVGAGGVGGSWATPMATSYNPETYQLTAGASFRMVVDVGNWDASRVVNTPGQSGNPSSAHYRDLASVWAAGQYFPLTYSRDAVERVTRTRITLKP